MENIFIKLLNMSIPASWIILVVLLLRVMLKRIPRNVFCILWALVAIRLICPVSFESTWSLIPSTEAIYPDVSLFYQTVNTPAIDSNDVNPATILSGSKNSATKQTIFPTFAEAPKPKDTAGTSLMQYGILAATIIWIIGMVLLILYTVVNLFKIHRRINESIILQDNILLCDHISTPFIWGIFHPRIILPSSIGEQHIKHVLAHEKAHISRHDYWWKPLGFVLLIIYWFNPLAWAAYKFFCRDIELACDEKVIRNYDSTSKKSYSLALLDFSAKQSGISAYPLAFGEIGVKERIKAIMKYKKPAFGIIFIAAIICIALSICFLTDPKKTAKSSSSNSVKSEEISAKNSSSDSMKSEEIWGYITRMEEDTIIVDLQNWTKQDGDRKTEYDRDRGFKAVDIEGSDVTFQLSKNCTYYTLNHHHEPATKLSYEEFRNCYQDYQKLEYPVLWFFTLDNNQITSIHEQDSTKPLPQNHTNAQPANEPESLKQTEKNISSDSMEYITKLKSSSDITYYKGGETWGYITKMGKDTITVDLQNWITEEDEEWKTEYDRVTGFMIVDVAGEDVTLQLSKNCTFHILEHHQGPSIELNHKKFEKYYHECQKEDYSVLWFLTFENNQITSIYEQYRP